LIGAAPPAQCLSSRVASAGYCQFPVVVSAAERVHGSGTLGGPCLYIFDGDHRRRAGERGAPRRRLAAALRGSARGERRSAALARPMRYARGAGAVSPPSEAAHIAGYRAGGIQVVDRRPRRWRSHRPTGQRDSRGVDNNFKILLVDRLVRLDTATSGLVRGVTDQHRCSADFVIDAEQEGRHRFHPDV